MSLSVIHLQTEPKVTHLQMAISQQSKSKLQVIDLQGYKPTEQRQCPVPAAHSARKEAQHTYTCKSQLWCMVCALYGPTLATMPRPSALPVDNITLCDFLQQQHRHPHNSALRMHKYGSKSPIHGGCWTSALMERPATHTQPLTTGLRSRCKQGMWAVNCRHS